MRRTLVEVPPHGVVTLNVNAAGDRETLGLAFRIHNALVAPKEAAMLELAVQLGREE